ncbi:thioredoxin family protein [Enterococcus faecium]|uniref:thioredoxin family protein n=1 Tax=Enterococcus faecium TaxID=1352 RepID=UPI00351E62E1
MSNNQRQKPIFIYFGRITCPVCREFAPVLANINQRTKKKIFYFNTEQTDTDPFIQKIRGRYAITTVPALIYLREDNTYETFNTQEYEKLESWLLTQ